MSWPAAFVIVGIAWAFVALAVLVFVILVGVAQDMERKSG